MELDKDIDEIVDANQVAILVVAHLPGRVMIDAHLRRQSHRLGEVNQPHTRVRLIVHEEQRAADHLVRLEELRDGQCGAYSTQALYVTGLRKYRKREQIRRR